jgi:hypothetical protein
MQYQIENTRSGLVLGIYEAGSVEEALDLMAQDAGYEDYAGLDSKVPAAPGELVVTEVAACPD